MSLPREKFRMIPVDALRSAEKRGPLMVYVDHWWAVDAGGNALFFTSGRKGYSGAAQCNSNRAIVERISAGYEFSATPVFLPWAYVQFDISDYA